MLKIVRVSSYDSLSELSPDVWEGFPDVSGLSVFVKPNLVWPACYWDGWATTRVEVTEMVVKHALEQGAKRVIVGDCGFKDQWQATMESTDYDELMELPNVEIIPLQDGPNFHKFTLKRLEKYRSLYGVKFSDYLLECDIIINVPKMKVHNMAGVTGAIKNMMGTMAQKGSMHPKGSVPILHKRLADLYDLTKNMVNFIVMDGIQGTEFSEQCGFPRDSNVLLFGTDQWEVDVAAAKLMGFNPAKVRYLRYISNDFDSVKVPKRLRQDYEKPLSWK